MRHIARFLLIGLIVANVVVLLGFVVFPDGQALGWVGSRIG